ncbi:DUF2202 domain-containing protein [Novosphingobium sp. ERN07]|uniref:ferritin-like domain-containing protein n=1 Tax=Novosphingobium sp. ERN07 TaxID=2726187 RepID=UPI001457133C|nr:DUF2202 domain-containing protein [Novosphingobium sp. ERN07]NLR72064.1 DUF2202 domain-containing protein [Novosphingobium sp. ERN07]
MTNGDLRRILDEALEDERKAEATYAAVLAKFGEVRPFSNIIDAERRHSSAIERQMARLGFPIPPNNWEGRAPIPASLAEACRDAVQAEVENIALYDRLLPTIADGTVRQVLENLQAASRDNHLPAFRRCLAHEDGKGGGGFRRSGRGRCIAGD